MYPVETIGHVLGYATLAMNVATAVLLALFFLRKSSPEFASQASLVAKFGLALGFLATAGGLVLSLFYSEVLGFAPCSWCWVMRIFMYSQVVLFALALYKRDRGIADYSIALSVFGMLVGLYQHYLQMGGASFVPCPATLTQATDCANRFLFELGYITFPLMGVSLFAFVIVTMLFVKKA